VGALLLLNPDRDNWLDLIPASASAPARRRDTFVRLILANGAGRELPRLNLRQRVRMAEIGVESETNHLAAPSA
jgi:hypothetical protein